jgi:hypothetical protein
LSPVEPPEADRRLEQIIPLVANTPATARLGGWDVETTAIHVTNAGQNRTVAEIRYYQTAPDGNVTLAGVATAELFPGGGRTFQRTEVPGGCICWAGVYAFDADGPGGFYSLSSLVAVSEIMVPSAGDALDIVAGTSREEIVSPFVEFVMPLVFKNYGGTEAKWSSLLTSVNVGAAAPVVFEFWSMDSVRGDARSCRQSCIITRYTQPGGMVTLNLGDEADPDIAFLGDGTYLVNVTGGGGQANQGGILPYWTAQPPPGGHVTRALHVSVTGRMATSTSGGIPLIGESGATVRPPAGEHLGEAYAPVLFKNYNGWNSGLVVGANQTTGGRSTDISITFLTEGGDFLGTMTDRISRGNHLVIYLPAVQFLPDGYRGIAIVQGTAGGSAADPGIVGIGMSSWAHHVHYDRNHAIAYDLIGRTATAVRTDAIGELPCVAAGFSNCAWAATVEKTGSVDREGGAGRNTGIRLMNPDAFLSGAPALVNITYIDRSGRIWADANEQVRVAPGQTVTVFPLYNNRLPGVFRGTARITAIGNDVIGVANTVDYSIMGRDASGSYNLQYMNGRTR